MSNKDLMSNKKILVFGATGKQGGAVVEECLRTFGGGTPIFAVTRNPESKRAKALEQKGVNLIKGDMDDASPNSPLQTSISLVKPTHAFLMSNEKMAMFSKGRYCKQELATANRMLGMLEACGTVQHVVMSSVAGCHEGERNSMPNFKVKADIEAALKNRGMNWTILRLVTLMDNFVDKEMGGLTATSITGMANSPTLPMWYVSCRDLGVAATTCFAKSSKSSDAACEYSGMTVNLASQKLCGYEICSAYAKAIGQRNKEIKYSPLMGPLLMRLGVMPDFGAMHRYWLNEGYPIETSDDTAFKELVPQPWTIDDFFTSLGSRQSSRHRSSGSIRSYSGSSSSGSGLTIPRKK